MSIGERILAARTDAGLSQRELAGETITRNMLSALEHDKAKPSLDTLYYLSEMLKRPVSYFLGEDTPAVEGYETLLEARSAYDSGKYKRCAEKLDQIPEGTILDRRFATSVGRFPTATRSGLTIGEFALLANETENIGCDLSVIACEGWKREMDFDDTDLIFVAPSPNLPTVDAAFCYIGT